MDYKDTINLPKTTFPMKARLPQTEPERLKKWYEAGLYEQICLSRKGSKPFILHDGPPYANGHIHIGTALNKILKDIIIKSKTMAGFSSLYVPGWDCHGLPIELNVEKKLGSAKRSMTKSQIRKKCREYARSFVNIQRDEFKRLGVFGSWDTPYLTMSNDYCAAIVREFANFADSGELYKRKKPIQWCASCRTALAEAEVEYADHTSPSVYVKFPVVAGPLHDYPDMSSEPVSVLIWTTTPWTLPANLAICLHPDFEYVAVKTGAGILVLAEGLLHNSMLACNCTDYEVINRFEGKTLEGTICRHPLYDRESPIIMGEHVTLEAGTGCVHTAPGHGQEDYDIGLRYGLDVFAPVDDAGRFTSEAAPFEGQFVFEANTAVIAKLGEHDALLQEEQIQHAYPHCWRCKKPVIFRATEQWFISMEKNRLREKALEHIDTTHWIPRWGRERIRGMVESRPDWCISRQRSWGVPIVIFYCTQCGTPVLDKAVIEHVAHLFDKHGSDIWFERDASDLMPSGVSCSGCSGSSFTQETDILDVWFDSGVSHAAVLEKREGLESPCNLYLEGSDQHRGWFQSSLLTAVSGRGRAPYAAVLTHGFVVDGKGEKMAKSRGNVIRPEEVIRQYGAEMLRLWVASENYQEDTRISPDILKRLSEAYRKIRNTFRFILGNIHDFDPSVDTVPYEELEELDQWALCRLYQICNRVIQTYERYEFHTIYHRLLNFCINDMSSMYLDIIKDRLYCSSRTSQLRKKAQTTLHCILDTLVRLIAPILSFTAEEIWQCSPHSGTESVHLELFPTLPDEYNNTGLSQRWDHLLEIRNRVLKELENARSQKEIGNALEASVRLTVAPALADFLEPYHDELADLFIVSGTVLIPAENTGSLSLEQAIVDMGIHIDRAGGAKCERCWKYYEPADAGNSLCSRCAAALE